MTLYARVTNKFSQAYLTSRKGNRAIEARLTRSGQLFVVVVQHVSRFMVSVWFIALYRSLLWLMMLTVMCGMFLACLIASIVQPLKKESNLCKEHAWRLRSRDRSTESRVNILLFLSSKVLQWDSGR